MCRAEGLLLMCKDREVYDLATETVLNEKLLSGFLKRNPCNRIVKEWMKFKYSSQTNTLARKLRGIIFGQGNRQRINEVTGSF